MVTTAVTCKARRGLGLRVDAAVSFAGVAEDLLCHSARARLQQQGVGVVLIRTRLPNLIF